jgi:predicted SAM-dependent methyltransferase
MMVTEAVEQIANRASNRNQWIRGACKGMSSILDVGSANGWVFIGSGLNVTLLDINEFPPCEFPRLVMDAHNLELEDGLFDCCVLAELLEHVHNPILVLKEAYRVASKRLVITVPNENNWSPDHTPLATLPGRREMDGREYYAKANPACVRINDGAQALHNRVYNKEMLLKHLSLAGCVGKTWIGTIEYSGWSWIAAVVDKEAPEMVKLNLGSFIDTIGSGWENIDILPLADKVNPSHKFRQLDVRGGLPYANDSVDLINASHFVEHLTLDEAHRFCSEVYRVLKPGGVVRISTPDANIIINHYINHDMKFFDKIQPEEYINAKTEEEKFSMLLFSLDNQHKAVYGPEMLEQYLRQAGFQKVYRQQNGNSTSDVIKAEVPNRHVEISLVMEAVK